MAYLKETQSANTPPTPKVAAPRAPPLPHQPLHSPQRIKAIANN